jgi:diguanylate cyclase (GGDEF)-like protein
MSLRTRIAVTFLLLLAAVLAAALGVVSVQNHRQASKEISHQFETGAELIDRAITANNQLLTLAAEALAHDFGFREALALKDTDTLISALENTADRAHAPIVVVTTLDGRVIAAYGSAVNPGMPFDPAARLPLSAGEGKANTTVVVESGHVYQLAAVLVKSPLPVARVFMGFELGTEAAKDMARITGLNVSLEIGNGGSWTQAYTTGEAGAPTENLVKRQIVLVDTPRTQAVLTLTASMYQTQKEYDRLLLNNALIAVALGSLLFAAIAIFWLARNITRPLKDLTRAVDHIRAGSYDTLIAVGRRDEIGTLAEGLQVMQSAVQQRDRSISRLAFEDTLTGLNNRAAFSAALTRVLESGAAPVGVAIINLHRFRRINELLGYGVGDAVLVEIAARLVRGPAVASAVGRLAADEFVAFAPLGAGPGDLQGWGSRLLARLADPIIVETQPIDISATVGLALAPGDATEVAELLRCADLAMERARRDKRALAVYEPGLQPKARDQLSLLGELQRAVDRNELVLFFQPKIELATGRVSGAEVLLRWQHPTRGLLAPGAFIPFAEQTGFIRQLTRWTLERAVTQCAHWYRDGRPLALAVNVSADDLADLHFDQRVSNALARSGLPPALLTLEVTESGFIEDPERALRMLDSLSLLGVNLSIDDFGTGYSSLSHLARMPVNEVKIDRSFVLGLESDPEFAPVVRSAIDMGHSLGMKVVAEGIENEASAQQLRTLNCDIGQGYLYAKPMPAADLEVWLGTRTRVPVIVAPGSLSVGDIDSTETYATL